MKIYLVQHGAAVAKEVNADRPLSEKGAADSQRLGVFMARAQIPGQASGQTSGQTSEKPAAIARIIHSNKTRARETARHLSDVLGPDLTVEEAVSGLAPNDSTDLLFEAVNQWPDDAAIVGHMPFLGRLLSRLMTGAEDARLVDFVPGTMVCLERGEAGGSWVISWMLRPEAMGQ